MKLKVFKTKPLLIIIGLLILARVAMGIGMAIYLHNVEQPEDWIILLASSGLWAVMLCIVAGLIALLYSAAVKLIEANPGLLTLTEDAEIPVGKPAPRATIITEKDAAQVAGPGQAELYVARDLVESVNQTLADIEEGRVASLEAIKETDGRLAELVNVAVHLARVVDKAVQEIEIYHAAIRAIIQGDEDGIHQASGAIVNPKLKLAYLNYTQVRSPQGRDSYRAGLTNLFRGKIGELEYWGKEYEYGLRNIFTQITQIEGRSFTLLIEADRARISVPILEASKHLHRAEQKLTMLTHQRPAATTSLGFVIGGLIE